MKWLRLFTLPALTVVFLGYTVLLVMLTGMLWLVEAVAGAWWLARIAWAMFRRHVERKHDEIFKHH